jgi:riboflavin biosynthesis pyrimidine reductase
MGGILLSSWAASCRVPVPALTCPARRLLRVRVLVPDAGELGLPPLLDLPALLDLYDAAGPHVRAGMVTSLDGSAALDGSSLPLSGPADRQVFRALRSVADVVLVGAGTARAEDYGPVRLRPQASGWRAARSRHPQVPLAVVSRSLRLDPAARAFAAGPSRPLVVTCAAAPRERRRRLAEVADVVVAGEGDVDLAAALAALADRGLSRVLCEGGPSLLGDLARAGLLDEVCATVAPVLAGAGPGLLAGGLVRPLPLRLVHLLEEDGVLLGRWRVER